MPLYNIAKTPSPLTMLLRLKEDLKDFEGNLSSPEDSQKHQIPPLRQKKELYKELQGESLANKFIDYTQLKELSKRQKNSA